MKKLLALFLALLLTLSLVACGGTTETESDTETETESESETVTESDTESETESETETEVIDPDTIFDARTETVYVNGANALNIRSTPSSANANNIVASLEEGASVERIGYNETWSKILYNGAECYASSKYLSVQAPPTFDPVENKTVYVKVESSLAVRSKPWLNAESVAYLSAGISVTQVGIATAADEHGILWARISYTDDKGNAKDGYINSAYLTEQSPLAFSDVNEKVVIVTDSLNLRAEPSLSGNVITTAKKGDTFQRIGIAKEVDDDGIVWSKVLHNGTTCYASSAYLSLVEEAKTFKVDGMNISLSDSFTAATSDTYAAQLKSDRLTVNVTKETLTLLAAAGLDTNMSLKAYAEKFIYSRELVTEIVEESNMTYFSYLTVPAGESDTVTVLAFVFKSADAYWMVQFQTPTATFPVEKANIFNYASSISFK